MNDGGSIWIGADPGGKGKPHEKGNFGLAIWEDGKAPHTQCVRFAEEAVQYLISRFNHRELAGVGVDAPLWWSSGVSSDREADRWLRRTYKLPGGAVQAANSLKGAALVQAVMFIERLRTVFGRTTPVTEVHPKALLQATTNGDWVTFAARYGLSCILPTEHERDALIGAIAAREGFGGRWPNDLSLKRLPEEQDPRTYWLAPVHYYWPEA